MTLHQEATRTLALELYAMEKGNPCFRKDFPNEDVSTQQKYVSAASSLVASLRREKIAFRRMRS